MGSQLSCQSSDAPSILQGEERPLPAKSYLHKIFERLLETQADDQTHCVSDDIAVWDGEDRTTFYQLNTEANQLARVLAKTLYDHGASVQRRQDALVGIMMPPSAERIMLVLACFKLGLAYIPIDPEMSDERIRHIWVDSQPLCLVMGETYAHRSQTLMNKMSSSVCLLFFDHLRCAAIARKTPADNLQDSERVYDGEDPLALVMYTSGSTGIPKGVQLTHSNVINRLEWQWRKLPYQCGEIVCHKTSFLFIDSVAEVFSSLLAGVPLVVVQQNTVRDAEGFFKILHQRYVTRLLVVPSLLKALLRYRRSMKENCDLMSVHTVVCSGEPLSPTLAHEFFEEFPTGKRLVNLYGSTEVCGDASIQIYNSPECLDKLSYKGSLSVGQPLDNMDIYIVSQDDNRLRMVEEGQDGEVCIAGYNVSPGYWEPGKCCSGRPGFRSVFNRNSAFVENLFRPRRGFLYMHCTGDIGVIHEGNLYLRGRKDGQVKIRGHRVSVWEVDNAVMKNEAVDQSVTVAVEVGDSMRLVCFYSLKQKHQLNVANLKAQVTSNIHLTTRPLFLEVDRIPTQPVTGKVDRESLKQMYHQLTHSTIINNVDSSHHDERTKIKTIIANSLGISVSKIRDSDDYFMLGGDSLSAIICVAKLRESGYNISVDNFTTVGTIGELTTMISRDIRVRQSSDKPDPMEKGYEISVLTADDDDVPVFLAQVFSEHDLVSIKTECPYEDLVQWLENHIMLAVNAASSFVIRRTTDEKLMAASLAFDYHATPPLNGSPNMEQIAAFLEECVDPKCQPGENEKWLTLLMIAADQDLPGRERLKFVKMLEENTIVRAKELGFSAIETINTSEVTMHICADLGYKQVKSTIFYDFRYGDYYPFEDVDENLYANSMIRRL